MIIQNEFANATATLLSIRDCLCELFNNIETYGEVQSQIQELMNFLDQLYSEAANLSGTEEQPYESYCDKAGALVQLINSLAISGTEGETTNFFNIFNNLYNEFIEIKEILGEGLNCILVQPGEPSTYKHTCLCNIFGLAGQLDAETNSTIDALISQLEALRDGVAVVEDRLTGSSSEFPTENCEMAEKVYELLSILEYVQPDTEPFNITAGELDNINNLKSNFEQQLEITKDQLKSKGIFPCADEVTMQTGDIYLQAAGSDGEEGDGSAEGIHLRWSFLKDLAAKHLPKGHLSEAGAYTTQLAYNKPNDFVEIFKTPYINPVPIIIDFANDPFTISDNGQYKIWTFETTQIISRIQSMSVLWT